MELPWVEQHSHWVEQHSHWMDQHSHWMEQVAVLSVKYYWVVELGWTF